MSFSSNFQKLVLLGFTLIVSILFNACGNPLSDQVTISSEPSNPEVVKVDLPADDDEFDGATAPWFIFDYIISNDSSQTFVLSRLELVSRRLGDLSTSVTIIDASQLEDGQGYTEYPLAIAVVEPKSKWQSTNNGGFIVDGERQGLFWYIQSLPVDPNQSREQQTTLYEVEVLAEGFFVPTDDDDLTPYERRFKFFTE